MRHHDHYNARLIDRVAYALREPSKDKNIIGEPIEVRNAFPYDPTSKTSPKTAHEWAKRTYYTNRNSTYEPEIIERDNTPFSITIVDLDVRGNGGRAYKVIDSEMRQFDLREDQVMEVLKTVGIQPMGVVPGQFVWGLLGSQMRLALVGGELHAAMTQHLNEKKSFEAAQKAGLTPTEATLQPGHIYRKRDKSCHLFVGRVKRPTVDKVQYAFVEMPRDRSEDDVQTDEEIDAYASVSCSDSWKAARKRVNAVARRWSTMTWRERCDFEWKEEQKLYGSRSEERYSYPAVVMMASPKFEADLGEVPADFLAEVRANEHLRHDYKTSQSWNSLSEVWKFGPEGRPYNNRSDDDWRLSHDVRQKQYEARQRQQELDRKNLHREYRDVLEWK